MGIFNNFVYKDGEIVDNSWVKWFHWGVPDKQGKEREDARVDLEKFSRYIFSKWARHKYCHRAIDANWS